MESGRTGVGCKDFTNQAEQHLLALVEEKGKIDFSVAAPLVMQRLAVRETDMNSIAFNLRKNGKIECESQRGARLPRSNTILTKKPTLPIF